jgi:ankyrin repeat protein
MARGILVLLLGVLILAGSALALARLLRGLVRRGPETAVERAAAAEDGPRLRALALAGSSLDAPQATGFTALDWAARNGRAGAIRALVAAGADPNALDHGPNGWTALMHAVHKGQRAALAALLAGGADANARARNGTTALMLAAGQGELELVEDLLASGADPHAADGGRTLLANAVAEGDPRVVEALLRRAPDLRLGGSLRERLSVLVAKLRGRTAALAVLEAAAAGRGLKSAVPARLESGRQVAGVAR